MKGSSANEGFQRVINAQSVSRSLLNTALVVHVIDGGLLRSHLLDDASGEFRYRSGRRKSFEEARCITIGT